MVDHVINALIAGVIGAVAFIAVSALVGSNIYDGIGVHDALNATNCSDPVSGGLPYNATNASASDLMIHDILPLAVAVMVVAGLFLGLTKVRGV